MSSQDDIIYLAAESSEARRSLIGCIFTRMCGQSVCLVLAVFLDIYHLAEQLTF